MSGLELCEKQEACSIGSDFVIRGQINLKIMLVRNWREKSSELAARGNGRDRE